MTDKLPKKGTKANMVLNHLNNFGSITAREMEVHPFYINCPYRIIDNLRDRYGIDILDEYIVKKRIINYDGKTTKITDRYKKYFLNKLSWEEKCTE